MSKKSLLMLLILPFLLSILFFVASSFLFTKIDGDITNIQWNYQNYEGFALNKGKVKLEAKPILANHQEDVNADLIWTVTNVNVEEEAHAYISIENDDSYLNLVSLGEVIVKCTNTSGNVSKSFTARIYEDGVIILNTKRTRSFNKIDSLDYYGEYDFDNDNKKQASFYLTHRIEPSSLIPSIYVEHSENIEYNEESGLVTILNEGPAFVRYVSTIHNIENSEYKFNVIKDGYNVYNYNELLKCTSGDSDGKIVCLQTNMESLKNTYKHDEKGSLILENNKPIYQNEDTVLFGNYDISKKSFNFDKEVYRFTSTYNTEFIDQYNEVFTNEQISKDIIAGIRIRKDFYGNGFIINAHDLTYPSGEKQNGEFVEAFLQDNNLFRGPLPFVLIGNITTPIVKAYGQDNIGFYVDGDNITLNDAYFKNCDFSNILQNNDMTGTVLEVNGDNVVIKNSHLSSGRTVLRSFSNKNLIVKNSLLEKGREFIAKIGSNEYEKTSLEGNVSLTLDGTHYEMSKSDFLFNKENESNKTYFSQIGEAILFEGILSPDLDNDTITLLSTLLQETLNDVNLFDNEGNLIYKNEVTFDDTYFYQSGIFSIGVDSLFNGPYLFDGSPVTGILGDFVSGVIYPNNIGGVSYPSNIKLIGDTRFYDYKTVESVDASCLVYQDIGGITGETIDLDEFFPIKSLFGNLVNKLGYQHIDNEKTYVNTPLAKYGGGLNLSTVNIDDLNNKEHFVEPFILDTFIASMNTSPKSDELVDLMAFMIGRCVSMAMGFAPFEVMMYNGNKTNYAYLYGEQISIEDLKNRA